MEYVVNESNHSTFIDFIPKLSGENEYRKQLISMHEGALTPRLRCDTNIMIVTPCVSICCLFRHLLTPLASIPLFLISVVAFTVAFRDAYGVSSFVNNLARTLLFKDSNLTILLTIGEFILQPPIPTIGYNFFSFLSRGLFINSFIYSFD